ncbi:NACHT domain-containing protein [Nostoc sp.]
MPESQEPKKVINNDLPNSQFGGGLINAETVNAGRIGGDIWNIVNIVFGRQKAADILAKNRQLLLAQVKQEVASRLEQSLHNAVLINLGKESQPQQVKRLWDAEVKIGLKPPEPIPDTTRIIDVFDSVDVAGKLLILGAPGSGKTTTQLELAQELIKRAEEQPDYPVPVLFNLSSWKDDRQPLSDWLVAELKSKYGVSIKFGKEWVDNKQLLPLLDGLDELEPQRQEYCVRAINQFLAGENRPLSLVVCSRSEEYSNYSTQLQLNGAIYLQHLSNRQICDYLTSINSIELWSTISSDLDLLELVKTPLLLSITVLAFQEISVEEWQNLNSTADQIQYLLDAYVGRMLTRDINSRADLKKKTPDARRTRMWLVWLAQQLQRESKTEFLIEEMQPSLLKTKISKIIYNLIVSVIIHGLIFWFFYDLLGFSGILDFYRNFYDDKNLIFSEINALNVLITGMFMGLILVLGRELNFGLIIKQLEDKIKNHALINPQSLFNKRIIRWLIIRLNFGLTFTQIEDKIKNHALINSQSLFNEEIIIALIEGLNFGFWGLIFGLSWGLTGGLIFRAH